MEGRWRKEERRQEKGGTVELVTKACSPVMSFDISYFSRRNKHHIIYNSDSI